MRIAGLVLAAGRGSRFGPEPKLLAPVRGRPMVRQVAETALASGLDPVIAVTGHRADEVAAALRGLPVLIARNPAYAEGLATSLRAGLGAIPPGLDGVVVLLGDMPLVTPATIRALIEALDERSAAVVPTHAGRRGNPVLLAARLFPELDCLAGDAGAGALLRARTDVIERPVDDPAILADIDTRTALRLWTRAARDP